MKKWKRDCPKCGEELFYSRIYDRDKAEKLNTNCRSCALTGRIFTDKARKNISEGKKGCMSWNKGKKYSKETRKRMSKSHEGKPGYWAGKKRNPFTEETLKNMRLSAIKRIEKDKFNGNQIIPGHNPKATLIIRAKAKELGITDLQDAETPGGEFQVCGYFVDGRSKEKNTVIEYYEKAHKYKKERDERRKQEIIKELGCEFIEIWE